MILSQIIKEALENVDIKIYGSSSNCPYRIDNWFISKDDDGNTTIEIYVVD